MHSLGAACVLERSTTPEGKSYSVPSTSGHSKSKGTVNTRTKTRHSEPSALPQTQTELSSLSPQHSMLGEKPDQSEISSPSEGFSILSCWGIRLQITAHCGGKKNNKKNASSGKLAHTQSAFVLTFCFLCLINLLIVSYSIFILFCVHVTVERNTGPSQEHLKGFSTGCLGGCGLREVLWTAGDQTSEEPTQACNWEPWHLRETLAQERALWALRGHCKLLWQHKFYFNDLRTPICSCRN